MGNLFLSFSIAICGAIGLVTLSKVFDLDSYFNKILPVIPILYAIIYEVFERKKANKIKGKIRSLPTEHERRTETRIIQNLSFGRVVTNVGVSFLVKFSAEMFLVVLFLQFSGQSFTESYGGFSINTVGKLLRGDHPWLTGTVSIYLLALISLITCFITGLWIGYTSKGNAILEGVLTGAAVTVVMSMTNMLVLYRKIEMVTEQLADLMGYALQAGFVVVIALQVLLYGLWSGLVQMGKHERLRQKVKR